MVRKIELLLVLFLVCTVQIGEPKKRRSNDRKIVPIDSDQSESDSAESSDYSDLSGQAVENPDDLDSETDSEDDTDSFSDSDDDFSDDDVSTDSDVSDSTSDSDDFSSDSDVSSSTDELDSSDSEDSDDTEDKSSSGYSSEIKKVPKKPHVDSDTAESSDSDDDTDSDDDDTFESSDDSSVSSDDSSASSDDSSASTKDDSSEIARSKRKKSRKQSSDNISEDTDELYEKGDCDEVCDGDNDGSEPCTCHPDSGMLDCNTDGLKTADICIDDRYTKSKKKFTIREANLANNRIKRLKKDFLLPEDCGTIKILDISRNRISRIDDGVFKDFKSLEELDLAYNEISDLTEDTFKGLHKLQMLDLRRNDLEILKDTPFIDLKKLKYLFLGYNRIEMVDDGVFEGLSSLETLELDNSDLEMIDENWFSGLSNLKTLSLQNNKFPIMPPFHHLVNLAVLKLSGNPLETIPERSFKGLARLEELQLNTMPKLTYINKCAFCGMDSLMKLEVSGCPKLQQIDEQAFGEDGEFEALDEVDFSNNSLVTLSENMLDWEDIEQVSLERNPWYCDCWIRWMVEYEISYSGDIPVTCNSPDRFKNAKLDEIEPMELTCSRIAGALHHRGRGRFLIAVVIILAIVCGLTVSWFVFCGKKKKGGNGSGNPISNLFSRSPMPNYAYRNLGVNVDGDEVVLVQNDSLDHKNAFPEQNGRNFERLPPPVEL